MIIMVMGGGNDENRCVCVFILGGLKCLTAVTRFRLRILRICLLNISLEKSCFGSFKGHKLSSSFPGL